LQVIVALHHDAFRSMDQSATRLGPQDYPQAPARLSIKVIASRGSLRSKTNSCNASLCMLSRLTAFGDCIVVVVDF